MTLKLRVTIEVVNEKGQVVDSRGNAEGDYPREIKFSPLQTVSLIREFANVTNAHRQLNNLHRMVGVLPDIML